MRISGASESSIHATLANRSGRLAVCLLLTCLSIASTVPASAQLQTSSSQQTRAYRKAARKAQKNMQRYSKQQQNAMKKSAKAQLKALKRSQQRGWTSGMVRR